MKNQMRMTLLVLLVMGLVAGSVYTKTYESKKHAADFNQQAITYIQKLTDDNVIPKTYPEGLRRSNLHVENDATIIPHDAFGGAYIDDNFQIHINITNKSYFDILKNEIDKIKTNLKVKIHTTEYAVQELEASQLKLIDADIFDFEGIVGAYVDIPLNKILILAVKDVYEHDALLRLFNRLGVDLNMIQLEVVEEKDVPDKLPKFI